MELSKPFRIEDDAERKTVLGGGGRNAVLGGGGRRAVLGGGARTRSCANNESANETRVDANGREAPVSKEG